MEAYVIILEGYESHKVIDIKFDGESAITCAEEYCVERCEECDLDMDEIFVKSDPFVCDCKLPIIHTWENNTIGEWIHVYKKESF